MKVVLLITLMFTLAVVHGQNRPCLPARDNNAYINFLNRHVVQEYFDRRTWQNWKRYLQEKNLCHRRVQTIIEKSDQGNVEQICQGHGWRYNTYSNLCISSFPVQVYDLTLDNNCQIQTFLSAMRYVVVACDKIHNVCAPVHFHFSTQSGPNTQLGSCR